MNMLNQVKHRSSPPPEHPWNMIQTWNNLLFSHWPVSPDEIRSKIPDGLTLDMYDSYAWITIIPFHMGSIRLRSLPEIPFISRFAELNVRTYVLCHGKPGIFFFSLDAANLLAANIARLWYHLPYFKARMSVHTQNNLVTYASQRTDHRGVPIKFYGSYQPVSDVFYSTPGTLEHWLTERYCFYTMKRRKIYCGEIHHEPWPLQKAELEIIENTMGVVNDLKLSNTPYLCYYVQKMESLFWPLSKLK